ncbi:unnamed protein product, partial [Staurois parvus]
MMSVSDILFTTFPVITDWPISNYMNRDLTQSRTAALRECAQAVNAEAVY